MILMIAVARVFLVVTVMMAVMAIALGGRGRRHVVTGVLHYLGGAMQDRGLLTQWAPATL
jgi:hypothetical protein